MCAQAYFLTTSRHCGLSALPIDEIARFAQDTVKRFRGKKALSKNNVTLYKWGGK